jgi:hypothetical protein
VRAKRIAALLAATAILIALGMPVGAGAAKPKRGRTTPLTVVAILGHADNGFDFTFFGAGSHGSALLLERSGPNLPEESVSYSTLPHGGKSTFKDGRLDARIGRLGRFRARFVPTSTETEKLEKGCTGDPSVSEKGYFVGSFSFHGEQGYTTIDSRRERGFVNRQGTARCPEPTGTGKRRRHHRRRPSKAERERSATEFRLVAGDDKNHVLLQGTREESPEPEEGSPTTFRATVTKRDGRLLVRSAVSVLSFGPKDESALLTPNPDHPLAEATVAPGAPFSGSADFQVEGPKTASWTGDLAVELPGIGKVPLTGHGIEAGVCEGPSHCTETLPQSLQQLLELSGGGTYYGSSVVTVGLPG